MKEQLTLVKLRERAGLTQRELAAALDVTITTVSAWENQRHEPRLTFAQTKLLTEILGCSLDELVEATQKQLPNREN
ncbi:helix-turn-helix transcriptional regulator [Microseira wollei]|uniref:HTH cro/C1-type domain-containing protein n=1 Tax=Microseira wollei NIES-4236 TaxID=2530354 RepID=A0AAV3XRA0_9CYAN|nr:helix-turn-helix transcriptional regulator [Microseira wollei]GET44293.1 hypothetical protein MiSe_91190 [Microseira wollei NIES-4236]